MTYGLPEWDAPAPAHPPALRVVPGPAAPLGAGVLAEPEPFDQPMVVRRVLPVTHDVVTVVLEPTRAGALRFAPGQYVVLSAEVDGRRVERCYTISSPPTRPHLLTVTVKRMPHGELSPWLHTALRVGATLDVRGPLGVFSVVDHPAPRQLLLSAGSGLTPTLSTLRTMADLADDTDVVVVHCARTLQDLPCRAELEALAAQLPGLGVHWVVEHDRAGRWRGPVGRIGAELLQALVPDAADREVFTCGPPAYMAAARAALLGVGADPSRCHEESFVLAESAAPAETLPAGSDAAQLTVRFQRSGVEVRCERRTTVLAAAREAGLTLPSSCESGLCGTCTSTLLSGEVDMRHQGGIRPRQVAEHKFLPCCSTPTSDLVVDA